MPNEDVNEFFPFIDISRFQPSFKLLIWIFTPKCWDAVWRNIHRVEIIERLIISFETGRAKSNFLLIDRQKKKHFCRLIVPRQFFSLFFFQPKANKILNRSLGAEKNKERFSRYFERKYFDDILERKEQETMKVFSCCVCFLKAFWGIFTSVEQSDCLFWEISWNYLNDLANI